LQTTQLGCIARRPAFGFEATGAFRLIALPFIRVFHTVIFIVGRVIIPALIVIVSIVSVIGSTSPAVVVPVVSVIISSASVVIIWIITASIHAAIGG